MTVRVLFVLEFREQSNGEPGWGDGQGPGEPLSSGLCNSARFVWKML